MPNIKDYFDKVTYKPKYLLGDRVRGIWKSIPFSGTVQLDTLVDELEGPYVVIHSDLPIKYNGQYLSYLRISHSEILEKNEKYGINSKTNTKK